MAVTRALRASQRGFRLCNSVYIFCFFSKGFSAVLVINYVRPLKPAEMFVWIFDRSLSFSFPSRTSSAVHHPLARRGQPYGESKSVVRLHTRACRGKTSLTLIRPSEYGETSRLNIERGLGKSCYIIIRTLLPIVRFIPRHEFDARQFTDHAFPRRTALVFWIGPFGFLMLLHYWK